jgi:hypothetical protein
VTLDVMFGVALGVKRCSDGKTLSMEKSLAQLTGLTSTTGFDA